MEEWKEKKVEEWKANESLKGEIKVEKGKYENESGKQKMKVGKAKWKLERKKIVEKESESVKEKAVKWK